MVICRYFNYARCAINNYNIYNLPFAENLIIYTPFYTFEDLIEHIKLLNNVCIPYSVMYWPTNFIAESLF